MAVRVRWLVRYTHSWTWLAKQTGLKTEGEMYDKKLRSLCQGRELGAAIATVQSMVDQGYSPSSQVLRELARLCHLEGDRKELEQVTSIVKHAGMKLDGGLSSFLIRAFIASGETVKARELFHQLGEQGVKPRVGVINALLQTAVKEKDVPFTMELLQQLATMNTTPSQAVSGSVLELATELGVKGQPMVLVLMQMYKSTEQVVESQVAHKLTQWLSQ